MLRQVECPVATGTPGKTGGVRSDVLMSMTAIRAGDRVGADRPGDPDCAPQRFSPGALSDQRGRTPCPAGVLAAGACPEPL